MDFKPRKKRNTPGNPTCGIEETVLAVLTDNLNPEKQPISGTELQMSSYSWVQERVGQETRSSRARWNFKPRIQKDIQGNPPVDLRKLY